MQPTNGKRVRIVFAVAIITLIGFALRCIGLAAVPPRWDEGWSIAHASLNVVDLLTITAADVHPPLFYLLLAAWQHLVGTNLFVDRYLAVVMSLPSLPLVFAAVKAWGGNRAHRSPTLALIAVGLMAWLPLAVYYSAVVRMYALAPTLVLLATWAGLRLLAPTTSERGRLWGIIAFVVGAAGAMLTLYHSVWALVALGVYIGVQTLMRRTEPERMRGLATIALAVFLSIALFALWGLYAIPQLTQRATVDTGNIAQRLPVGYFAKLGIEGLTMSMWAGVAGLATIGAIAAVGLLIWAATRMRKVAKVADARWCMRRPFMLVLPVFTIVLTIGGVAAAAQRWAFDARMLIGATPALAILLAWCLDQWARAWRPLMALACVALVGVYWTTSTSFVYQKSLEVFDPYNPHTYVEHILPRARATDEVFFNVLSPAGFYALDRSSQSPSWSYALTWDPVIEPQTRWQARITQSATTHSRLWLVLYRGLTGANGDLRGWMDTNYYPATAEWGEEGVFYGLYGVPREPLIAGLGAQTHWQPAPDFDLELRGVQLPATVRAGEIVPVALTWRANTTLKQDFKVFVHAFNASGGLVAQHDAQPLNDLRPMHTLPVGADVSDHHGLPLPAGFHGSLRVVVGLYDPATGQRARSTNGQETIEIGRVDVAMP